MSHTSVYTWKNENCKTWISLRTIACYSQDNSGSYTLLSIFLWASAMIQDLKGPFCGYSCPAWAAWLFSILLLFLFHHHHPQSSLYHQHGVSSHPMACCLSLRSEADTRLCSVAREETGASEVNSSQRAGQLGTSRPSNYPAARLNLQLCAAVRLKEAAWSHQRHNVTLFSGMVVGGNWRVEGLIGLPRCSLELRTTEAEGRTRVW